MLTAKLPASLMISSVEERSLMQTSSILGSSDREETALAVKPCGCPSLSITEIIVTPLANDPITRKNRCFSMDILSLLVFCF